MPTVLGDLDGEGWVVVDPPEDSDTHTVVGRYADEPIRAGVLTDKVEDDHDVIHYRYRTGCYDLDVKVDFDIGRGMVRVERAEGYSRQKS